jgi:antitoxin (DNA-binding transcriptional repressor) of toxin-antitoxin stability system
MCVKMHDMRSVSVREAQHHLARVLAWVEAGEEVQVMRRKHVVARIIPERPIRQPGAQPDFMRRLREMQPALSPGAPSMSDLLLEERESSDARLC